MRRAAHAIALFALLLGTAATARAQPTTAPDVHDGATPAAGDARTPAPDASQVEVPRASYWSRGEPRPFISGVIDLGFLYVRPRFHFGWGRPHSSWIGIEANPLVSGEGVGAYAGLRGEYSWLEVRVGGRYFFTFQRSFLSPRDRFTHLDIQDRSQAASRYLSLEAQLQLDPDIVEINHSLRISLNTEITGTYITLVDPGLYVFEETLKVVVEPPWLWSVDFGVRFAFGPDLSFYVQPRAEIVHLVGRNGIVLRVGLQAGVHLWPDLEIRVIAEPAILSPDDLGAVGGDTFLLGLRYRWATGMPD